MSGDSRAGTALITGASAGIGEELARVFAANGHDLVLVARRKAALDRLARALRKSHEVTVTVVPRDLGVPDAPQSLFDDLLERELPVDILVNNAGVLFGGGFRKMPLADIEAMLDLNVRALTSLTRLFVEPMIERGDGHVLNVASLGAFQPVPSLAVYAATKAYVLSLSEALAEEVRHHGVRVGALCPGFTDTAMLTGASGGTDLPGILVMPPERVAEDAYRACMRGDVIKVPGIGNALASTGVRLLPRWLVRSLSGMVVRGGR